MFLKGKRKKLARNLLSIPIAIGLIILFIILSPLSLVISIIFIIKSITKVLLKMFRFQTYDLDKELKSFREKSLPDFKSLEDDNNQNRYQTAERILYGYQKLNKDEFDVFLKLISLPAEGSNSSNIFSNTVGWIGIIPKIFLFLFYKALAVLGLGYSRSLKAKCRKYKDDISNALLSSRSNSRSGMEQCVATSLSKIIYENIVSISSSDDRDYDNLVDKCFLLRRVKEGTCDYSEKHKCIVKNIKIMIDLLSSDQLDIKDPLANEKFNKCFRELMAAKNIKYYKDPEEYVFSPELIEEEFPALQEEVLNFFAKNDNKAPDNLHGKDKKDYILKCCEKMLEFGIEGGQLANPPQNGFFDFSNKIAPPPPEDYAENAQLLADALAKSIVKGLNSKELHNVYNLASKNPDSDRYKSICHSLKKILSRERVVLGLNFVLECIHYVVNSHIGFNYSKDVHSGRIQPVRFLERYFYDHSDLSRHNNPSSILTSSSTSQDGFREINR